MRRLAFLLTVIGGLGVGVSAAAAAMTVGQAAPPSASGVIADCSDATGVQAASAAGTPSYTVPSDGVLTSFTTRAGTGTNATTRVYAFRNTSPGNFLVVGRSEAEALTPSSLNRFPTRNSTRAGDLLGLKSTGANFCLYAGGTGDVALGSFGVDPQPGSNFTPAFSAPGPRWNVEAVLEPDADNDGFGDETQDRCPTSAATQGSCTNAFTLGALTRNKKKGTATITANLPNPGDLTASGKGVKVTAPEVTFSRSVTPGTVQLVIKAMGKKRRKLNQTGKVKLNLAITYTPTGGSPNTQSVAVKLKKK